MGFNDILKGFVEIHQTRSRLEKDKIFKKLIHKEKDLLKTVLLYTFDPFQNYYVSLEENDYTFDKNPEFSMKWDMAWSPLQKFLDKCKKKDLTGNAARDALKKVVGGVPKDYRYWIMRIVNRDLKIGLSSKTIQKYIPGLLPFVEPMRCGTLDIKNKKQDFSKYEGWFAEPKYDGLRATVLIDDKGRSTIISRKGKPMWNCGVILDEIQKLKLKSEVFDGEIFGKDWNKTLSTVHTQSEKKFKDLKFNIFDLVPLDEWLAKKATVKLRKRKSALQKLIGGPKKFHALRNTPNTLIPTGVTRKDLKKIMEKYLRNGFEGIVMKNPRSVYSWKRSKDWLKVKPVYEGDFKIVDFKKGTGKHRKVLGAIFVQGKIKWKGMEWKIYSRVGSGFSDKQRKEIWKSPKRYLGKTVQVEFQEVSKKKNRKMEGYHALRFGVFVRLRPDKD